MFFKIKNWTLKGIHHAQETYNLTLLPIIVDLVSPLQQHVPLLDPKTLQQLPEWNTVDQILAINISKLPSLPTLIWTLCRTPVKQPPPMDQLSHTRIMHWSHYYNHHHTQMLFSPLLLPTRTAPWNSKSIQRPSTASVGPHS